MKLVCFISNLAPLPAIQMRAMHPSDYGTIYSSPHCQKPQSNPDMDVTPCDNLEPATQPLITNKPEAERRRSSQNGEVIRDVIIGFADGLTVPFALTAGLSSLGSTRLVVMGGLAELFSGCISMGLGAYLAAATEREAYTHQRDALVGEYIDEPKRRCREEKIYQILADRYSVSREATRPFVEEIARRCTSQVDGDESDPWVKFVMDVEVNIEAPDVNRAWISALTMGLSYFIGGLVPMIPYFLMSKATEALVVSIAITVCILLIFGYIKNWVMIRNKRAGIKGALQTLIIGALAAGTSYAIVRALD